MRENVFTIRHSNVIKGIAIIMMMFHHCFLNADRYSGYEIVFYPFAENSVNKFCASLKICVSLFAFISGYGLFSTLEYCKNDTEKALYKWYVVRMIKTLSGYWFVIGIMSIICQITRGSIQHIFFSKGIFLGIFYQIIQFLGLSSFFDSPMLIGTWWYMGCAILFIFLVPLVSLLLDKKCGSLYAVGGVFYCLV